ncbi:hypothetical protein [Devosia sp.]|uniref:hypothetical protein n=1 Tax=Devosia sp. TaxID=1871048 RepID=UPI0025FCEB04|nr:hypothetical protein [Devosia sp.]MCR6633558.1 hypothetical protein [Devosia sp.]
MAQSQGGWDGRRRALALGMISNVIGALAAAGAAIAAWLTTTGQSDLTQWALILAGIGGVFVAKGTVILAIAESRPYTPQDGVLELQQRLTALENRLSARSSGLVGRLEQIEADLADLRPRS